MKLAKVDLECVNGNGWGYSFYGFGCPYRCDGCFNKTLWNFNPKEFTELDKKTINNFCHLLSKQSYINRISILGGESLLPENVSALKKLILTVKELFPKIQVYVWTGTTVENLMNACRGHLDKCDDEIFASLGWTNKQLSDLWIILNHIDYLIDGRFVQEKKDLTLKWRGSSNQRILTPKDYL